MTASCCRISSGPISTDVIADMNAHGFAFDAEWFRPHWEFRFPHDRRGSI